VSRDHFAVDGPHGRIELTGGTLASVVARAAESVPGVRVRRPRRGVDVAVDGSSADVVVRMTGPLDGILTEVGESAQHAIADVVGAMTGLAVSVDITFEELA
jgi:uncharacterized alkaline shock family protein YloU